MMRRDRRGQAALVDAILFMTILLLASAVVIASSGMNTASESEFSGLRQYASDFTSAFLSTELKGLHYTDLNGDNISGGSTGIAVSQALCDEALIKLGGSGNFTCYEDAILTAGRNLIRPGLDFAVSCDVGSIFVSGLVGSVAELPPGRCAGTMDVSVSEGVTAALTVYVWVI